MNTAFTIFTNVLAVVGIWQLKTWGTRAVDRWHDRQIQKIRQLDEVNDMHVADQALANPAAIAGFASEQVPIKLMGTNAERADLIDALLIAIEGTDLKLVTTFSSDCLLDNGALLEEEDKRLFDEWVAQKKRFTSLREYLLREESAAIAGFAPAEHPRHDPNAN